MRASILVPNVQIQRRQSPQLILPFREAPASFQLGQKKSPGETASLRTGVRFISRNSEPIVYIILEEHSTLCPWCSRRKKCRRRSSAHSLADLQRLVMKMSRSVTALVKRNEILSGIISSRLRERMW